MIFGLFAFLVGICLTLILVGMFLRKYSGISLFGFGILFILSFILLSGNLEINTGTNSTVVYAYNINGTVANTTENIQYEYDSWNDATAHQVGFWLAIFSAVGFIVMLYTINKGGQENEER